MRRFTLCAVALLPFVVKSADIGVSWSVSELNQPVQFGPIDDDISAINHSLQLNYSGQDWLIGSSFSKATSEKVSARQRTESNSELSYDSYEVYANYFHNNWTFSAAVGRSDIAYRVIRLRYMGANRVNYVERTDQQAYNNKDNFYELSTEYYFDLSESISDFSISIELNATYYITQTDQTNRNSNIQLEQSLQAQKYIRDNGIKLGLVNARKHEIDESLWVYQLATNFDYGFTLMKKSGLASIWYEKAFSSKPEGSFTASRLRNNSRVIRHQLPLSATNLQSNIDDVNTYGISVNLALSDSLSTHLSWLDSNLAQPQWQFGLSYWFY